MVVCFRFRWYGDIFKNILCFLEYIIYLFVVMYNNVREKKEYDFSKYGELNFRG